jgi:hypothetical protein
MHPGMQEQASNREQDKGRQERGFLHGQNFTAWPSQKVNAMTIICSIHQPGLYLMK